MHAGRPRRKAYFKSLAKLFEHTSKIADHRVVGRHGIVNAANGEHAEVDINLDADGGAESDSEYEPGEDAQPAISRQAGNQAVSSIGDASFAPSRHRLPDDPQRPPLRKCRHGCEQRSLCNKISLTEQHDTTCPLLQSYLGTNLYTPLKDASSKPAEALASMQLVEQAPAVQAALCSALFVCDMVAAGHYSVAGGMFEPLSDRQQAAFDASMLAALTQKADCTGLLDQVELDVWTTQLQGFSELSSAEQAHAVKLQNVFLECVEVVRASQFQHQPNLVYILPQHRHPEHSAVRWYTARFVRNSEGEESAESDSEESSAAPARAAPKGNTVDKDKLTDLCTKHGVQPDFTIDTAASAETQIDALRCFVAFVKDLDRSVNPKPPPPRVRQGPVRADRVPTLKPAAAIGVLHAASAGFMYQPILRLCGVAQLVCDVLHMHLHVIQDVLLYLVIFLNIFFRKDGSLKTQQEVLSYQLPKGRLAKQEREWRARGF